MTRKRGRGLTVRFWFGPGPNRGIYIKHDRRPRLEAQMPITMNSVLVLALMDVVLSILFF